MSRNKVILSIALLVILVLAGIVLPTIWKQKHNKPTSQTETSETDSKKETTASETEITALKFLEFENLSDFFSDTQISSLKTQCITYLLTKEKGDITSITFQPDKTSYPDKSTLRFVFALSDDTSLPITYSTPTGAFYFGEEQLQVKLDTTVYQQKTDDSLPSLTTDEIEVQQEGGYADTDEIKKEVRP